MPAHTIRLFSARMEQLASTQFAGRGATARDALSCVVAEYLKDRPYPGTMRATVTAGNKNTYYFLGVSNNTLNMYRRAGRFPMAGALDGTGRAPASGGRQAVRRYAVSIYADRQDPVDDLRLACRPADVPRELARIAASRLGGNPRPNAMRAAVRCGTRCSEYVLLPEDGALCVYRRVPGYESWWWIRAGGKNPGRAP